MKGTNRKEMRKLLNKYIALMKEAFDGKLNFEIDTRLKIYENNRPWFTGRVSVEGCDYTDDTQDGVEYLLFACYEWRDVAANLEQFRLVEEFVKAHKK